MHQSTSYTCVWHQSSRGTAKPIKSSIGMKHHLVRYIYTFSLLSSVRALSSGGITHTVTWIRPNDAPFSLKVKDGECLRTAALQSGIASPHNGRANTINCRGLGTCGTCAVEIQANDDSLLPPRNAIENARLNFPPHKAENKLRLACQIRVKTDLTVKKYSGFWGHKDELVEPSKPTVPFGELEYILDSDKKD